MSGPAAARILFAPRQPPPLRPDAAHDVERYRRWAQDREDQRLATAEPVDHWAAPAVVVLMAVDDPDASLLARSLSSLAGQTHRQWTLSVATPGVPTPPVSAALEAALEPLGRRGLLTRVPTGASSAEALAEALAAVPVVPPARATAEGSGDGGPGVFVLWPEDELTPDALALLVSTLESSGGALVHADEDRIDADGDRHGPVLVPDWSPDLLLSAAYLGRGFMVRRGALDDAGGYVDVAGGCAEHDLMLRLTERLGSVVHCAEVLYHRRARVGDPPWPAAPGPGAVERALERRGAAAAVEPGPLAGTWSVQRRAPASTRVSVVVPFRDGAPFLRACVDSVSATATGVTVELVLVDNGSTDPETRALVERLAARPDVTVHGDSRPFNWATLNNGAAEVASGEVLVFLNNDIECHRDGWLEALTAQALRADVGAVGARLLYPDGHVQHAGVVVGLGGAAGHLLTGLPADEPGYLGLATLTRDCSAVTGACLATRRTVFDDLHGFDDSLGLDLNDIDYCLRARAAGLRVVYEPRAELVHHESPSRGTSGSITDIRRFIDRWEHAIVAGDPHLNTNLTRIDSSCALRGLDETGWWQEWRSSLQTS